MIIIQGTPVIIDGKTGGTPGPATTTLLQVNVPNPTIASRSAIARSIQFRHVSGAGNLLISLPSQRSKVLTLKPSGFVDLVGSLTHFWVASSAGSVEWEAVATVAA